MSKLGDYEARIIAALKSIPELAGVNVKPCMWPEDAFLLNLSKQSEIYVCHLLSEKTQPAAAGPGGTGIIGTRHRMGRDLWAICSVSTSYASPAAAQSQTGGVFELCEAVEKIVEISIGQPGAREEHLLWNGRTRTQAPNRSVTGGGSVGYISEFEAPQRFF